VSKIANIVHHSIIYLLVYPVIALGWVGYKCLRLKGMTDLEARRQIVKKWDSVTESLRQQDNKP
jgi:hypothetical protein